MCILGLGLRKRALVHGKSCSYETQKSFVRVREAGTQSQDGDLLERSQPCRSINPTSHLHCIHKSPGFVGLTVSLPTAIIWKLATAGTGSSHLAFCCFFPWFQEIYLSAFLPKPGNPWISDSVTSRFKLGQLFTTTLSCLNIIPKEEYKQIEKDG